MDLETLVRNQHAKYIEILNLWRFMQRPAFCCAFSAANEEERKKVNCLIDKQERENVEAWVREILRRYNLFENLNIKYLKEMAQEAGLSYYSMASKVELISGLKKKFNGVNGHVQTDQDVTFGNEAATDKIRRVQ